MRSATAGQSALADRVRRDPDRVAATVNRGWLSPEKARAVYRVVLTQGDEPGLLVVDKAATERLRREAGTT